MVNRSTIALSPNSPAKYFELTDEVLEKMEQTVCNTCLKKLKDYKLINFIVFEDSSVMWWHSFCKAQFKGNQKKKVRGAYKTPIKRKK